MNEVTERIDKALAAWKKHYEQHDRTMLKPRAITPMESRLATELGNASSLVESLAQENNRLRQYASALEQRWDEDEIIDWRREYTIVPKAKHNG